MSCVALVTGSVENIPQLASSRMRHGTRAGYRRTTLNQMFMPTYLSSNVFAPLEICILTDLLTMEGKWLGYQLVMQVH